MNVNYFIIPCIALQATEDKPDYDSVMGTVCSYFHADVTAVMSKSRKHECVLPRYVAWSILRQMGFTLKGIGEPSGHDHTTVIHGIETLKYDCLANERLKEQFEYLLIRCKRLSFTEVFEKAS